MKKNNKNIDKYRQDRLPGPEIPADEAWAQMNAILDTASAPIKNPGVIAKLSKYKWMLISICVVLVIISIVLMKYAYQPLRENDANFKRIDTAGAITLSGEKNAGKIADAPKPVKSAASEQVPLRSHTKDFAPKNQVHAIFNAPDTLVKHVQKVTPSRTDTPDKSVRSGRRASNSVTEIPRIKNEKFLHLSDVNTSDKQNAFVKKDTLQIDEKRNTGNLDGRASAIAKNGINISTTLQSGLPDDASENYVYAKSNAFAVLPFLPKLNFTNPYHTILPRTINAIPQHTAKSLSKKKTASMQFGPEWGVNTALNNIDYLFAGKDAANKPALLLIPGIFVSGNWNKHAASFTFSPYQSYFGNGTLVSRTIDSTLTDDSLKIYEKFYNTKRLMKASGFNFSAYYHLQATKLFAFGAGISYSFFSTALVRKETEKDAATMIPGALATLHKSDLRETISPHFFAVKTGILFNPGRLQAGLNLTIPLTHIPATRQRSHSPLNGQLFLRVNLH